MATAITGSNLTVGDSDELSSKIFTAFLSCRGSLSALGLLSVQRGFMGAVTTVVALQQTLKTRQSGADEQPTCPGDPDSRYSGSTHRCRTSSMRSALILASAGPCRNEISLLLLPDFIVFMVCIVSTRPLPPLSEQLDKIHLMMCQVRLFSSSSSSFPAPKLQRFIFVH